MEDCFLFYVVCVLCSDCRLFFAAENDPNRQNDCDNPDFVFYSALYHIGIIQPIARIYKKIMLCVKLLFPAACRGVVL